MREIDRERSILQEKQSKSGVPRCPGWVPRRAGPYPSTLKSLGFDRTFQIRSRDTTPPLNRYIARALPGAAPRNSMDAYWALC